MAARAAPRRGADHGLPDAQTHRDADEALELGLVHRGTADDELRPGAVDLAGELAEGPQVAMRLLKRSIYQAAELSFPQALDDIATRTAISDHHPDAGAGLGPSGRSGRRASTPGLVRADTSTNPTRRSSSGNWMICIGDEQIHRSASSSAARLAAIARVGGGRGHLVEHGLLLGRQRCARVAVIGCVPIEELESSAGSDTLVPAARAWATRARPGRGGRGGWRCGRCCVGWRRRR